MSDSEAPLLCPVCLVSMGVQLSEECSELGEREETYILNTNLTPRGMKLLKLLIKKTRLIKIFEIYRDKSNNIIIIRLFLIRLFLIRNEILKMKS